MGLKYCPIVPWWCNLLRALIVQTALHLKRRITLKSPKHCATQSERVTNFRRRGLVKGWIGFHFDSTQVGSRTRYVLADPQDTTSQKKKSYAPPKKFVPLRQGNAAARGEIGPLTKTRRGTETGSRLRRSVCSVLAMRRRGTIIIPWFRTQGGVHKVPP